MTVKHTPTPRLIACSSGADRYPLIRGVGLDVCSIATIDFERAAVAADAEYNRTLFANKQWFERTVYPKDCSTNWREAVTYAVLADEREETKAALAAARGAAP